MKKKYFLLVVLFLLFLAAAVLIEKEKHVLGRIEREITNTRRKPWSEEYKVISHALGGIDGKDCTNSFEALEYSYENGQRVVEADFCFTSDGVLVLQHYWKDDSGKDELLGNAPTLEEFKQTAILGSYTPMTAEELIIYMSSHKDLYLVTDVKHKIKSTTFEEAMEEFVETAKRIDASVLKRVIVQIYRGKDYYQMEKIYPFYNYIFTLYKGENAYRNQYGKVADFCNNHGISVVTMPAKWIEDQADIKELTENDIRVYVHTVNEYEQAVKMLEFGVNGIYSDYLYERDLTDDDVQN